MTPRLRQIASLPPSRAGFTLIEILVTMTIFGLVLSSLTVALRSGLNTWRSVRSHQTRQAELAGALGQLGRDFDALTILSKDTPAINESVTDANGDDLSLTILGQIPVLAAEPGFEWANVRYYIKEIEDPSAKALVRELKPMVGPSPMSGGESETVLLQSVRTIQFGYVTPQETLPQWQDAEKLPVAIEIRIEFDSGPPLVRVLAVTAGLLQAGSQS